MLLGGAGLVGALVLEITHAVVVAIGAALRLDRPCFVDACVVGVEHAVLVGVGRRAALVLFDPRHVHAAVDVVGDAVAIGVRAAGVLNRSSHRRATIVGVDDTVAVLVRRRRLDLRLFRDDGLRATSRDAEPEKVDAATRTEPRKVLNRRNFMRPSSNKAVKTFA